MADTFIAVTPSGVECWGKFDGRTKEDERSFKQNLAEEAIRKSGVTCDRKSATNARVKILKLVVKDSEPTKEYDCYIFIDVPFKRMDDEEFNEAMKETLKDLPEEFASFVEQKAWDDGHSAGYEEVVNLASGMAYSLGEAFKKYTKRIGV